MNLIRTCDFCSKFAEYDGKTINDSWAYMCKDHFSLYGVKIKGLYTIINNSNTKEDSTNEK